MSAAQMTPMLSPDGRIGDVPSERVGDALKAGFKLGAEMIAPNGQPGVLPMDNVPAAMRAGFRLAHGSAAAFAASSVPKPPNPLQGVAGYDALGPIPDNFSTRVGNRIQQNVQSVANLPAEAMRETQQAETGPHSAHALITNTANALYGALQKTWRDYHDPANIAGDVATAAIGGAAAEGAEPATAAASTATKAPAELSLVPKLTRAYDYVRDLGGGEHPAELSPVLDGLNELTKGVLQRVQERTDAAAAQSGNQGFSSILQGTPKAVRSFADVREDQAIQDAMNADLENQGMIGRIQVGREVRAANDASVPKWQRLLDMKIQQLVEQETAKQEIPARYTKTPPLSKFPLRGTPTKATAAAPDETAVATAEPTVPGPDDDLTSILKASLDIARKKKGLK